MTYQCLDCSYKNTAFTHGRCPACGSMNIKKQGSNSDKIDQKARKPYRLAFALALWGFLLIEIYRKLST